MTSHIILASGTGPFPSSEALCCIVFSLLGAAVFFFFSIAMFSTKKPKAGYVCAANGCLFLVAIPVVVGVFPISVQGLYGARGVLIYFAIVCGINLAARLFWYVLRLRRNPRKRA